MNAARRFLVFLSIAGVFGLVTARGDSQPKGAKKMYGLIGKIVAVDGKRDDLIAVLSQGTGAMPGCLSYVIAKDPADASAIWITEVWQDEASHRASLSLPAVREAITKGKPLIAKLVPVAVTEPVGGHGLTPAKRP
jgi:quinol monooxygenase YgiN